MNSRAAQRYLMMVLLLLFAGTAIHSTRLSSTVASSRPQPDSLHQPKLILTAIGDSLSHGTMDATNNFLNTRNAYLEKIAESFGEVTPIRFTQPYFNIAQQRINPYSMPTNLAVDGAEVFSIAGIEYYRRAGRDQSLPVPYYQCEKTQPNSLADKTDRVLFPLNLRAGAELTDLGGITQVTAARWWLQSASEVKPGDTIATILWIGNNDSSLAALGQGGNRPAYFPIPPEQVKPVVDPRLALLLEVAESLGIASFAPYTQVAIERNLTDLADFSTQFQFTLEGLRDAASRSRAHSEIFVVSLPYYSAVGYLMDSDDLEFYLRKLDPEYSVPPTFARVAPPGEPIVNPLLGDRVSLLTFGLMYALMSTGSTSEEINEILEVDGVQQDGLVLSEAEQQFIVQRIDGYNAAIAELVADSGPHVHLIDVGGALNELLTANDPFVVGDFEFTRKWSRGNGFSLDGVHPGYTAQALIANLILTEMNAKLGTAAPLHDLEQILLTDPYVDMDRDGWVPGPQYAASGITSLLFLLSDPDDNNSDVGAVLPSNVWELISAALLEVLIGSSSEITELAIEIDAIPE